MLFAGCQSIRSDRVQETVDAGNAFFSTEAAHLGLASIQEGTQVMATIQSKETDLAVARNINQQIAATVGVSSSPTPALVVGAAAPSGELTDSMPETSSEITGESQFVVTGVSQSVRASDDCVTNASTSFQSNDVQQLYLTFIGSNVQANTPLTAEWYIDGQLLVSDQWVVPNNFSRACFWFVVDRNDTNFPPGSWSAQLLQNGALVGAPQEFTING